MELYIGGYAQGKLNYVLNLHNIELSCDSNNYTEKCTDIIKAGGEAEYVIADCAEIQNMEELVSLAGKEEITVVLNHFNLWVRGLLLAGKDAKEEVRLLTDRIKHIIIISDETGNGIVPLEAFERDYRETLGRILTELAKKAERVERIICGLGQRLK